MLFMVAPLNPFSPNSTIAAFRMRARVLRSSVGRSNTYPVDITVQYDRTVNNATIWRVWWLRTPLGDGARMRRVLLTGMSGTGKSSVIRELAQALEDQRMFQPLL